MPSTRLRQTLPLLAVALVAVGCSSGAAEKATPVGPAPETERAAAAPEGRVGLSPGGVTTKIDVPAQSTEEQYAQACLTAKDWMTAKGGDPDTLVEPYLKEVQSPAGAGPETGRATFGKSWADLSEAEQAAVIIAVRAAADGGC